MTVTRSVTGRVTGAVTGPVTLAASAAASLPVNTLAPSIAGDPYVGETLTATPGAWTGADSVVGEWYVNNVATGDTDTSYTVLLADAGKSVEYLETATNGAGSVTQASNTLTIVDWSNIVLPSELGHGVSFSRSTTGTYMGADGLMHVAAINEPRYGYGPAGDYRGLLVEKQSTNHLTYSGIETGIAGMVASNVADESINWFGMFTKGVRYGNSTVTRYAYKSFSNTIGVTYCLSVYIKMDDGGVPVFGGAGSGNDGGLVISGQIAPPATVESMGGGIYRVSSSLSHTAVNVAYGVIKYSNNSARSFVVTGYQLEAAAFASSYIPTTSVAVTRGEDDVSIANLADIGFDSSQGTMLFDGYAAPGTDASNTSILSFNDGTANERIDIRRVASSTTVDAVVTDSGTDQFDSAGVGVADNAAFKASLAWALNDFAFCVNAGTMQVDNSGTLPTLSRFAIGAFNGKAKNVRYYPRRLSNTIMQAATT